MAMAVISCALLAASFGGWEIVLVIALVLVLFGARKLPEIAKGLGTGFREFQDATNDLREELGVKETGLVHEALTCDNRTAEFVYPRRTERSEFFRSMILFIAQGFGAGRIPFAPGTFGSVVGLLWFAALLATKRFELFVLGALAGGWLSVWVCGAAERILKQKDPSSVVIDEIIAMPFCFLPWVTAGWLKTGVLPAVETLLTGRGMVFSAVIFGLFRLFDIWKPWPVRQSQGLSGGWGVTVDDVLAACYVALVSLFFLP